MREGLSVFEKIIFDVADVFALLGEINIMYTLTLMTYRVLSQKRLAASRALPLQILLNESLKSVTFLPLWKNAFAIPIKE